jgi:hypothetical protein
MKIKWMRVLLDQRTMLQLLQSAEIAKEFMLDRQRGRLHWIKLIQRHLKLLRTMRGSLLPLRTMRG